jgi:acetyltransferase
MKSCKKPIYPILPSVINVKDEIQHFLAKGRINFPDEVVLGNALAKVYQTEKPQNDHQSLPEIDKKAIKKIMGESGNGYLSPEKVQQLLDAAGINRAGEAVANTKKATLEAANKLGYPIVMKVVGPVHKSDVGGVVLNVKNDEQAASEFNRMMQIKDTTAVLIQPMLTGTELFVGAKKGDKFGQMVLCGLGGIFIEVLKDVQANLAPIYPKDAIQMIKKLKSVKIIEGLRGREPVNQEMFAEIISRVSALCMAAPEIFEMDLNPLLGSTNNVVAVDARIRIEK